MKNNFIIIVVLLTIYIGQTNAQNVKGSGALKTESIELKGFKKLILNGSFNVVLMQDDMEGVRINSDDNLVNLFQIRMDEDILYITMLADIKKYEELNVYISYRELTHITLLKAVNVLSKQVVHFDELNLFLSGNSTINTELFTTVLKIQQNDQSFCKLKGFAEKLFIDVHDETELNCFSLKSDLCQILATGYSEVMVNCEKTLKLKVTGESNVYYMGEPNISERIFSSNGFIVKRKSQEFNAE